jgi:4-amino-4-deoxy-L-arabinose transferase-like glycosyltransferase
MSVSPQRTLDLPVEPLTQRVQPARPIRPDTAVPAGWTLLASRLAFLVFLLVVAEALFSVPKLTFDALGRETLGTVAGLLVAAGAVGIGWLWRERAAGLARAAAARAAAIPARRWLVLAIAAGLALRLAWALLFPAPFTSDGLSYYKLAVKLANGEAYVTPTGGLAEWPPGYPFLLLAHFLVLGVHSWVVTVVNLLLFAATIPVVWALARRIAGEGVARLAVLLLALWPNLIAMAGVANKEGVIVLLLPLALLLYLAADERTRPWSSWGWRLGAGLALGYATLSQPGVMLAVGIFPVWEVLRRTSLVRAAGRFALLLLGMALIIAPWTARNHRVFGQHVLISTNGGSVFYRANNPLATGGYVKHGERRLTVFSELEADAKGYQWGKEWIQENPGAFLRLAVRKQILFLGDDSMGPYESLRRGLRLSDAPYAAAKLAVNAFWWGIWALILLALLTRPGWHRRPEVLLLVLAILYFWAIDSVFESGSRHHIPLVGLLAILAAGVASPRSEEAPAP